MGMVWLSNDTRVLQQREQAQVFVNGAVAKTHAELQTAKCAGTKRSKSRSSSGRNYEEREEGGCANRKAEQMRRPFGVRRSTHTQVSISEMQ